MAGQLTSSQTLSQNTTSVGVKHTRERGVLIFVVAMHQLVARLSHFESGA